MVKHNLYRVLALLVSASLLLAACSPRISVQDVQQPFQPVSDLRIPEVVTLVGVGEATHGNAEFVKLRRDVLEILATQYGFRAFAIEGDFGGAQVVNDYVLNGTGTAEEAVRAIGFAIYRTQEMVDLVEWIRQYNQSVAAEEQIHFYGFDMQRYDHNIRGLLAYLEQVDPEVVEPDRAGLADLNDTTVFDQQPEKIQAGLQMIEKIRADMQQKKTDYIKASSEMAFDLADQFATSIEENARLRSGSGSYVQLRSEYMAKKVRWIVEYEKQQGRGKVMIAGHTGHIEKSAAAPQYRSMGSRLSEELGNQYFAIGAEFVESKFNCKDATSGERKVFSVKNKQALNKAFEATGMDTAYLDIQSGLENPVLQPLLSKQQAMSNIGDSFSGWYAYLPQMYTIRMVPAKAYDAVFFVRSASPTHMLAP